MRDVNLDEDRSVIAAVARCLAQMDDRFIGAADWDKTWRRVYEQRAERVLRTVVNVQGGNHTGGLPTPGEVTDKPDRLSQQGLRSLIRFVEDTDPMVERAYRAFLGSDTAYVANRVGLRNMRNALRAAWETE